MRRPQGTGTVERWRGRYRARLPTLDREVLGIRDTPEDAAELLDGWLAERFDGSIVPASGLTLRSFGAKWLDRREFDDYRAIATDRSRWRKHVERAAFIDWPLKSIARAHVIEWVDDLKRKRASPGKNQKRRDIERRRLGRSTIQSTLNLLRCCLADALERGLVVENVADGVRLRMKSTETEDPWTYLTLDEQRAVLSCQAIPAADRLLLAFAIGTGMREGEIWNLQLRDLRVDGPEPTVFVRFGSKGRPPKNGKTRTVPLFGIGLEAAKLWLEQLGDYIGEHKNEHALVFPTRRGCRRRAGKPSGRRFVDRKTGTTRYEYHDWIRAAGIERDVRFHDLRHTCCSALVSGMWGRRWSLEEVRDLAGHKSIKTTERYAHLAPSALQAAAQATPPVSHHEGPDGAKTLAPPTRLELVAFGLGSRSVRQSLPVVGCERWLDGGLIAERLATAVHELGHGDPFALGRLIKAAEEAALLLGASEADAQEQSA